MRWIFLFSIQEAPFAEISLLDKYKTEAFAAYQSDSSDLQPLRGLMINLVDVPDSIIFCPRTMMKFVMSMELYLYCVTYCHVC